MGSRVRGPTWPSSWSATPSSGSRPRSWARPPRTLARAGVTDLVVVVGRHGDQVRALLGDGAGLGVTIAYAHQEGEAGIADALARARGQVGDGPLVVILGDQVFQDDLAPYVQ